VPDPITELKAGDRVEILMGTYRGCHGTVETVRLRRVQVKLDLDSFIGAWEPKFVALLNALDRLVEET
jgi:transcription antitermination factor NusG